MVNQITKPFLIAAGLLIAVFACTHEPIVVGPIPPSQSLECHPDTAYFVNDILPLMVSQCAIQGCHDAVTAEDDYIIDSYQNIMHGMHEDPLVVPGNADESELYESITDSDPDDIMPPPPANPLNTEQIALIRKWINQGAKHNECINVQCDTSNVGFQASIMPIINKSCNGCHSASQGQGYVILETYAQVSSYASDGSLLATIQDATGYPDMPPGPVRLNACEIETIQIWINDGYPDN